MCQLNKLQFLLMRLTICKSGESSHLENGDSAVPVECDWSNNQLSAIASAWA